ncbi:ASCH domain-containing protein [Klebsiella variicola]|nr:ASCH domain-containing protein [Klebsiella variicola]
MLNDIVIDHHLKIIETGDSGVGEHTHSGELTIHNDQDGIISCRPMTLPFFSVFRRTSLPGAKRLLSAMRRNRILNRVTSCALGAMKMTAIFCTIAVTATSTVTLDTLTEQHAQQENMTLEQLRQVIREIYPAEDRFYVIEFKRL